MAGNSVDGLRFFQVKISNKQAQHLPGAIINDYFSKVEMIAGLGPVDTIPRCIARVEFDDPKNLDENDKLKDSFQIENILLNIPWFTETKFNTVKSAYNENGMLIIFLGAFTPLPYKIITITSGMAGINIIGFILMSVIGRDIRFFVVAYLTKFFGMPALLFLKKHLLLSSTIFGIAIMLFSIYIF